jgi:hypothetical protein
VADPKSYKKNSADHELVKMYKLNMLSLKQPSNDRFLPSLKSINGLWTDFGKPGGRC